MINKKQLGKQGEQIAENYLKQKNYKILAKNYRTRRGEIDLICQKEKIIHFVEVKTRTNQNFGWPEEAVGKKKLEKIAKAAQKYLEDYKINSEWQIDIVSIIIDKKTKRAKLSHFKNITVS